MRDRFDLIRGWFSKAESDLATARGVTEGSGPYDTACFHAQQAAEKYLKGLLAYFDAVIPFTHNLEELEVLCKSRVSDWPLEDVDVTVLTPYAVQMRYDFEFWPDKETALEALELSGQIRDAVLSLVPEKAHP